VRVKSISLNLGEVQRALTMAEAGWRPGWDLAGVVEQAAADHSGPPAGARGPWWNCEPTTQSKESDWNPPPAVRAPVLDPTCERAGLP
jgi:hypothetical protein